MSITPGTRLGSYEVTGALGAGGMGQVYRARDTKLGREVAIKVVAGSFDPERAARFRREAQLLAALNHPHIATIHGLEETADMQFLVMELVEGGTLADRLRNDRRGGPSRPLFALDEALDFARQVADALQAAHEKGIIHRDLKPIKHRLHLRGSSEGARLRARQDVGPRRAGAPKWTCWVDTAGPSRDGHALPHALAGRHTRRHDSGHGGIHGARAGERARGRQTE